MFSEYTVITISEPFEILQLIQPVQDMYEEDRKWRSLPPGYRTKTYQ